MKSIDASDEDIEWFKSYNEQKKKIVEERILWKEILEEGKTNLMLQSLLDKAKEIYYLSKDKNENKRS